MAVPLVKETGPVTELGDILDIPVKVFGQEITPLTRELIIKYFRR